MGCVRASGHIFVIWGKLAAQGKPSPWGEGGAYAPDEGELSGKHPLISHLR